MEIVCGSCGGSEDVRLIPAVEDDDEEHVLCGPCRKETKDVFEAMLDMLRPPLGKENRN